MYSGNIGVFVLRKHPTSLVSETKVTFLSGPSPAREGKYYQMA
jgi:hypothetical protein